MARETRKKEWRGRGSRAIRLPLEIAPQADFVVTAGHQAGSRAKIAVCSVDRTMAHAVMLISEREIDNLDRAVGDADGVIIVVRERSRLGLRIDTVIAAKH